MKKWMALSASALCCLLLCGCTVQYSGFNFLTVLLILLGLAVTAFGALRAYNIIQYNKRRRRRKLSEDVYVATAVILVAGLILLVLSVLTLFTYGSGGASKPEETQPAQTQDPADEQTTAPTQTEPPILFAPQKTSASDPANWGITWEIFRENTAVADYTRETAITFGDPEDYFALPGIGAFRGNNYRNSATYGTAAITSESLSEVWSYHTTTLEGSNWSGSGWTGQPLIVQWDTETKKIMNLYDYKKAKENLVEVVYATLDGHIYFYDLDDGSYTRDPINMQMNFKGAGALDPRGYPLLYVGGGIYQDNKAPRMYVVSLITGEILYTHGNGDGFARRNWSAFDSSPLVDASSDTLIWPGENGVLYTIKLNTSYDKEAGTISVDPDYPVKTRYTSPTSKKRYYGYESSASVVDHWLYVSENSGMFYCVDLNTMELVWAQDTKDDSNSSPIFEWGPDNQGYIYTAPSLHWTAKNNKGSVSVYKLNAQTGEIVWERPFECMTVPDLSGGVQSSPILGQDGTVLEDMIIYNISRVPSTYKGVLVAMDTETGETIWQASTGNYAWSSPVPIYTEDGKAYIFLCDAEGNAKLYDGETGEILDKISFGSTVEASPIVFNNKIINIFY